MNASSPREILDELHHARALDERGDSAGCRAALHNVAMAMAPPPGTLFDYDAETEKLTITHLSGDVSIHSGVSQSVYDDHVAPLRYRKVS